MTTEQPEVQTSAPAPQEQPDSASSQTDPQREIAALKAELALLHDQLLRKAADFENYKKRVERERQQLIAFANERLILALLPILDDLERSLEAAEQSSDFQGLQEGIRLVHRKFLEVLKAEGVEPFSSTGQAFDYTRHEAFMEQPTSEVPPGTVVRELQKGYTLRDRVIRHAKVIVSRAPDTDKDPAKQDAA